jgi:hypothetical protein
MGGTFLGYQYVGGSSPELDEHYDILWSPPLDINCLELVLGEYAFHVHDDMHIGPLAGPAETTPLKLPHVRFDCPTGYYSQARIAIELDRYQKDSGAVWWADTRQTGEFPMSIYDEAGPLFPG